ncbi:MAG: MATE family efflux transporter [Phycisphaeraceae bacterium]|jgi:putative MATE family efflux protein
MPDPDTPFQADDEAPGVSAPVTGTAGDKPKALAGRLAGMPLGQQIFVLAIWPFFQQLLSWLVSFVDTAVAGHLTKEATSAIAVGGYINWFMGLMVMGIGSGGAALIARAIGGGHKRLASAGVGQSLLLGTIVGVVVGLVVFALAQLIGVAAGLADESLALCRQYLWITAAGVPLASVLFVGAACMTAAGDTRNPFYVMVAMNVVNLIITLILALDQLVIVHDQIVLRGFGLGVVGIGLGTVVGWFVGALLMVWLLLRPSGAIRLHPHRLRPHWHTVKRIWRVAYPNLLDRGGHWVGNWIIIMLVGMIGRRSEAGDAVQGAHIIAIRIEAISFLPALAFAAAASTLTGQYLGANDPLMARKAARQCWMLGAGIMTTLGLVFITVPDALVRILTDIPIFLETSPDLVRICGFVQFFFGSALVLQGAMRGAGDTRVPAILSNTLTWFVRLPAAFILGYVLELGLVGIWYALCGELLLRGIVFIARYLRDGWLKVEV